MNEELVKIRHIFHQNPELANHEIETSKRITHFMGQFRPDKIIDVSNTGKLFVFDSQQEGPTTVFRADMDALPIPEENMLDYTSLNHGVAHLCGHDGHMTILLGLAQEISKNRPQKGKVVLLFQPAEESEQGARDVVNSTPFKALKPDFIFGLHNIPKAPLHQILVKNGGFAAASKGMTLKLYGKSSHAAEPEKGRSPADAIAMIIQKLHLLRDNKMLFSDVVLLTIINIKLGEIAFGTSPGYAEIRITLRSFENEDMEILTKEAEKIVTEIAQQEQLEMNIEYSEIFPATLNDEGCLNFIKQSAKINQFDMKELETPFKWSEDFGYYSETYKTGFFGLGSGTEQAALHNPDFDFPDQIIETGIKMFYQIYKSINFKS